MWSKPAAERRPRMASRELGSAILDLTQGEAGIRGSAEERDSETAQAARILAWTGGRYSTCTAELSKIR
jgi:hypothetical protein